MPIYSDGNIYGISIKHNYKILFEKIYKNKINKNEYDEFVIFYQDLTEIEKNTITISKDGTCGFVMFHNKKIYVAGGAMYITNSTLNIKYL